MRSIEFDGFKRILSLASSFEASRGLRVKAFLSTSWGTVSIAECYSIVIYIYVNKLVKLTLILSLSLWLELYLKCLRVTSGLAFIGDRYLSIYFLANWSFNTIGWFSIFIPLSILILAYLFNKLSDPVSILFGHILSQLYSHLTIF
jgi:hypothetical protein